MMIIGLGHVMDEIEPLRAAIENGDIVGHLVGLVEGLDGAHAETLVGQRILPMPRTRTLGFRSAISVVLLVLEQTLAGDHRGDDTCRLMISSRTAT